MTTLDRLRFLLTSHGYKHANKFISNGQGVNITSHSCVSPPRPLSFHSKDIKEVFHRTAAKGHLTLTCSQLSKCFCTVSVNRLCWNCGSTVELFFCSSFKVIQPPDDDNTNYFDIMNCEQTFSLDTHKLQKRYVELQRSLHPDNFSQKSLLELKGILLEEGTDATADPQFLLEVMEVNESLAETQGQDEVSAIGQSVREKLKDLTKQINSSLSKGDLQTTKDLLTQMKYYTNIEEKVKERLTKGW
ncbi:iron-sulfur cluster co-chaperone protein HscB-like isoform X6 [Myxocyprinus asiaticus]|uniref:iron-sulfur cluster co-chaperone protein HscB-like isoform X6 n=1 Tax=Myxocyprinus asiaticus TaxID=70543 RepID=UPI002222F774|nr:iron-sulfur cluster co-chaperone protein HscB-like isoform X6 [Myxocyprinus asiaticus]